MLIVNADDWGGWKEATDAALAGYHAGTISSVSAMVFTADAERAAKIALEVGLDVGLHLNLDADTVVSRNLSPPHRRVIAFLRRGKYAQLIYNPMLRDAFRAVFRAQWDEFSRLYGRPPSHVNGHHHMHLCANMLLGQVIPAGERVRTSFSFQPGEKSLLNRAFRSFVARQLRARYRTTDYFFSLERCLRKGDLSSVATLAKQGKVELMAHPEKKAERAFLLGSAFWQIFFGVRLAGFSDL